MHDARGGTRQPHPEAESLQGSWADFRLLYRCASICTCYACMADVRLGSSRVGDCAVLGITATSTHREQYCQNASIEAGNRNKMCGCHPCLVIALNLTQNFLHTHRLSNPDPHIWKRIMAHACDLHGFSEAWGLQGGTVLKSLGNNTVSNAANAFPGVNQGRRSPCPGRPY